MLFCLANSSAVSNSTSLLSVKSALLPTWEDDNNHVFEMSMYKSELKRYLCCVLELSTDISLYFIYQYSREIWLCRELVHLVDPLLDVVEAHLVGDIEDDDDAQRPPVAAGQNGPVPLLAPRIPDLHLDLLIVDNSLPGPYIHPDCRDKVVCARVIQEFVKKTGFSHTRVSDL